MSSDPAPPPVMLSVRDLGKCYHIYDRPQDRLRQILRRRRKRYYREFWALRGLSFELRKGDALGIVGQNGSGKSTLLQLIAGTLQPSEGEIRIEGRVAALLELGSGFNPNFTGRENVYMNGAILGLSRREIDERFDDIAAFADIGEFLNQPVQTYSSGMMVRLAFAVQVQVNPDILIIDEALAVGDALFQKRCFQRLEELRAAGVTLLFVSHDQESVRTLTSNAILLHEGCVRSSGPSGEVLLDYRRLLHDEEKRYFDQHLAQARNKPPAEAGRAVPTPNADGNGRSDRLSFGDFDAEVLDARVLGGSKEDSVVYPGEKLAIRVRVRVNRDMNHLNVAVRIRNKQGVKMYSWGTLNQDMAIWAGRATGEVFWERSFRAGDEVVVDFECICNLGVNLYEVQAAVSEERDRSYNAQRILHWRDEAAFFQVLMARQEYFFGGACDMRMTARVRG